MNTPADSAVGILPEETFLTGNSEMAKLILARDWSATPLGPIGDWPQSLRTTVSLCLASNFPINIIWGPHNTQIYNDGYRIVCGDKHPDSLGMDYAECWASAWPAVGPSFEQARGGQTSFLENQRMFLFRNGYLEETFFTFSLSPIRDESGNIGGLFHPVTETTATMIGERRTRALRDLNALLGEAGSRSELYRLLMQAFSGFELDLPFVLLYAFDADAGVYRLAAATGIRAGTALSPETLAPQAPTGTHDTAPWPMSDLVSGATALQVSGLRGWLQGVPCGPYDEVPHTAFALPIHLPGGTRPEVLLLAGASARLPVNDAYAGFYDLLGAALAAALARVDAVEEERKRAEMLAAIDRAKTVFFSNVSHEFRTPLTLMLGPLEEALQAGDLPAAQRARLEIANRNAARLLRLVNTLLDFSRIEAGRTEASYAPADLAPLTAELASNFRSACERAGLALVVDCVPLPEAVYVDVAMWEKIVLNLVSNAFKFTLAGHIAVRLRDAGGMAELRVEDTGVGIPAADVGRVFERFHRVEGQGGRSVEGSGIGLSLVQELVRLHQGTIAVESAQGAGTVFTVRIPYGAAHLPRQRIIEPAAAQAGSGHGTRPYLDEALRWLPSIEDMPQQAEAGARKAGSILLADDNADMRAYVQRILVESGYQVHAVANGREALDALRAGMLPDLVLSDVMMPELDGFALLAAVRADPATSGVVMMLLSARAGEEARLEGLNAGADDYLVKPFGARELRARVDGAVSLARQRREAAAREQALRLEIESARDKAALQRSEEHGAALFEQTSAGMAEAGLDGRLLRVNARYCQLLGRAAEELVGQRFEAFIHPDDAAANRVLFEALVRGGTPYEIENRVWRTDGATLWVNRAVTLIHAGPGEAPSVLAVYTDITGRKRAEAELHEAARRKDEFLAMLAHELRNPLAPIRTAAELMGVVQLDRERIQRTSEVITRQVRHMTGLIDDLLDVSRVTRGLVDIVKSPQDLHAIVANAIEQVKPVVEAHRHRLVLDLDPGHGRVLGDEKRLVQILTNLLNNAAKYTPPGGAIRLRTEIEAEVVHLSIHDTGIGIAPELQQHVFELFTQAERTPDRSQGGLGLGLALVKNLVELHGGRVACHSEGLGKGSTFIVELPRLLDPAAPAAHAGEAQAAHGDAGTLDILVVDDNADAAFMLKLLLEASGHAVRVAHDAVGALESVGRRAPDVAILDIGLPGMDGNALARLLRTTPATAGITLIAVTGYGQEHDLRQAMEAGFDQHLVKPVDMARLAEVLEALRPH
jgi:PAS domain S-box-containing protein